MHIETREGHVIHVKDMGSGHPVILIHGWPLTGDMWEYQTLAGDLGTSADAAMRGSIAHYRKAVGRNRRRLAWRRK